MKKIPDVRPVAAAGDESLDLIRLPLDGRPGFEEFLGAWLLRAPGETALVDCGVAGSYAHLKKALDELGAAPNLLLLTHIHLDHCGAAGCLCRDYPGLKVFCCERAAPHLISPEKLWQATAATLGEAMAAAYRPPLPVPASALVARGRLSSAWRVVDTPGHASHHVSFLRRFAGRRLCFGGEALGVLPGDGAERWFADGRRRDGIRPATPPRYVPETGRESMKKLAAADWDLFCAGHFGASADRTLPERALKQNLFWEKRIAQALDDGLNETEIVALLRREDLELADIAACTESAKRREEYFLGNSVRGFVQFLGKNA